MTQALLNNYGGVLQNFALQQVLRKLGHDPITLDYIPPKSSIRVLLSLLLTPFLFFTKKKRKFQDCLPCKRDGLFQEFISRYIITSEIIGHYNPSLIRKYNLDAIIVGSDQVWRPIYNKDVIFDMYLKFTSNFNIRRVAYAASFGVSSWEYSLDQQLQCAKLVKDFDAVSVREDSAALLCRDYLGVNANVVLDPTLLLSESDYLHLLPIITKEKDYVLTYILNPTSRRNKLINGIVSPLSANVINVCVERRIKYSIEDWLSLFLNAKYIITDSFHGTVFSIIFHKQFSVLDNPERGSSRLQSLLKKFGLLDHIIIDGEDGVIMPDNIEEAEWNRIDSEINRLREYSIKYLIDALE